MPIKKVQGQAPPRATELTCRSSNSFPPSSKQAKRSRAWVAVGSTAREAATEAAKPKQQQKPLPSHATASWERKLPQSLPFLPSRRQHHATPSTARDSHRLHTATAVGHGGGPWAWLVSGATVVSWGWRLRDWGWARSTTKGGGLGLRKGLVCASNLG